MSTDATTPVHRCRVDWRTKASTELPELDHALGENWSVHVFFTELLDLVVEAHRHDENDELRRGYGFANWCLEQPGRFLANAAVVSFYEHLFDDWDLRESVARWLPDGIGERVRPLWEWRLPVARLAEVDRLLGLPSCRG